MTEEWEKGVVVGKSENGETIFVTSDHDSLMMYDRGQDICELGDCLEFVAKNFDGPPRTIACDRKVEKSRKTAKFVEFEREPEKNSIMLICDVQGVCKQSVPGVGDNVTVLITDFLKEVVDSSFITHRLSTTELIKMIVVCKRTVLEPNSMSQLWIVKELRRKLDQSYPSRDDPYESYLGPSIRPNGNDEWGNGPTFRRNTDYQGPISTEAYPDCYQGHNLYTNGRPWKSTSFDQYQNRRFDESENISPSFNGFSNHSSSTNDTKPLKRFDDESFRPRKRDDQPSSGFLSRGMNGEESNYERFGNIRPNNRSTAENQDFRKGSSDGYGSEAYRSTQFDESSSSDAGNSQKGNSQNEHLDDKELDLALAKLRSKISYLNEKELLIPDDLEMKLKLMEIEKKKRVVRSPKKEVDPSTIIVKTDIEKELEKYKKVVGVVRKLMSDPSYQRYMYRSQREKAEELDKLLEDI